MTMDGNNYNNNLNRRYYINVSRKHIETPKIYDCLSDSGNEQHTQYNFMGRTESIEYNLLWHWTDDTSRVNFMGNIYTENPTLTNAASAANDDNWAGVLMADGRYLITNFDAVWMDPITISGNDNHRTYYQQDQKANFLLGNGSIGSAPVTLYEPGADYGRHDIVPSMLVP